MRRNFLLRISLLIGIILLIFIHLPLPFSGDQAFFLVGAEELNAGKILYKDFWDIKQPGVFYFFLIAGKLFGFSDYGIHLGEAMYWLVFGAALLWFYRKYEFFFSLNYVFLIIGIFILAYYGGAGITRLTQVEALVNFPIMLVVIFNLLYLKFSKHSITWLFLSGLAGGCVLFFKLMFLFILLPLWFITFIRKRKTGAGFVFLFKQFLIIPLGIFVFWLPFLIYCYNYDCFQLVFQTYFIIPPEIIKEIPSQTLTELISSSFNFFSKIPFLTGLAFWGIFSLRKHHLKTDMAIWLLSGILVILMQRTSWYSYHFQLLLVPITMLAAFQLHNIIHTIKGKENIFLNWKISTAALLILVNLPALGFFIIKGNTVVKNHFGLSEDDRIQIARNFDDNNQAIAASEIFPGKEEPDCPIFVVNDPLIYYYTKRTQAITLSGWSLQLFLPHQWAILYQELDSKKPCYIYMENSFQIHFYKYGKKWTDWLSKNYFIVSENKQGKWYALKN